MNRSLTNVLFGGIAPQTESDYKIEGQITKTNIDDTVEALANAESVIIVGIAAHISICSTDDLSGCWLRDGRCKSTICHLRNYRYAEE